MKLSAHNTSVMRAQNRSCVARPCRRVHMPVRSFLQSGTAAKECVKGDYVAAVEGKRFDKKWTSYYGNWFVNLHDETKKDTMNAMRCFKYVDDNHSTLQQMNVYQKPFSPNAKTRPFDKLYDVRFTYDAVTPEDLQRPLNIKTHNPTTPEMVSVGECDREAYARVHLSVPGSPAAQMARDNMKAEGQYAYKYMLVELFLADGIFRWSLCACYDVEADGAPLILANLAQEKQTRLDPEHQDVVNVYTDIAPDVRPGLGPDPALWVPSTARMGTISGLVADPTTGNLVYVDPADCEYEPPPSSSTKAHRVLQLPDSMYAVVPESAAGVMRGEGRDFWLEFGGVMRRDGRFERLKVGYERDGGLQGVLREIYG